MTTDDAVNFGRLWVLAYENYSKTPSDSLVQLAFNVLKAHRFEDISRAVMTHISASPFAPKPSDINELIGGDPDSRKLQAWTMVETAVRRVGGYESVVFDDPAIMAVIDEMGGWIAICDVNEKELPFRRNEFLKRYTAYLHRPPAEFPRRLCGRAEQSNGDKYADSTAAPKLIGNTEKARLVYRSGGNPRMLVVGLDQHSDANRAIEDQARVSL